MSCQELLVPNVTSDINGHTYHSPHKWIVCFIGNDRYDLTNFLLDREQYLQEKKNLSISIMGLSNDYFENHNIKDYQKLCLSTSEGTFTNIVDKGEIGNRATKRFMSMMDVYPSEKLPIMKELIQGI